jgi:prepilin-type N-terminal cleavage/methylation domain-containing protein
MHASRRGADFRGFTLVEMMVVIVIILMLAAILLPSLRTARVRAMKAASQAQITGLSSASENYYAAFNAYPGYLANADLVTVKDDFTMNQNMMVSLMGLVDSNAASTPTTAAHGQSNSPTVFGSIKLDISKIGSGPFDRVTGKTYAPFYSAKAEELAVIEGTAAGSDYNSDIPHLVDTSSGMPLLMWRINKSGDHPVSDTLSGKGYLYLDGVSDYVEATALKKMGEDQVFEQKNESLFSSSVTDHLQNLAWAVIDPRSSDVDSNPNESADVVNGAYVFIAPGPDGIYFSKYNLNSDGTDKKIDKQADLSNFDDVVEVGGTR